MRHLLVYGLVFLIGCGSPPSPQLKPDSLQLTSASREPGRQQLGRIEGPEVSKTVTFRFPFPDDVAVWTVQGNDQGPSHQDAMNRYAFDFAVPEGTPICAAADGIVIYAYQVNDRPTGNWQDNNELVLRHGDGTFTAYLHVKKGSICVVGGQVVHAGDVVAKSGNTGASSGPHLHFCRLSDWGNGPSIPCKFVDVAGDGVPKTGQQVGTKVGRSRGISERIGS